MLREGRPLHRWQRLLRICGDGAHRCVRGSCGNRQRSQWDRYKIRHASNWDEEDVRAIIAYLRVLPAVNKKTPADRAPAADDCVIYTFWTSVSHTPGCN